MSLDEEGHCYPAIVVLPLTFESTVHLELFCTLHDFHRYVVSALVALSSVLAWRIPGTGEPGGMPSGGMRWGRTESDTTEAT